MFPRKFKYVIVDDIKPRICSLADQHSDMVGYGEKATSAGFARLQFGDDKFSVDCFGDSLSLNLKSDPEDHFILERLFSEPY